MTTSNNPLPENLQPIGDLCVPVSVPNDTEWLWLLAKCLSFPTARRFWRKDATETDLALMMAEWDSRVYNPTVEKIIDGIICAEQEIDNCLEYANNATFLAYSPQNPHTQPDFVPDGYPNQPFFKFGAIVPESLPDWLEGLVGDWLTDMTGYESNDVLTVINSFPLFASWEEILTSGLPRITLQFSGVGIVQLRLLLVPFGGRAIISIDIEPNIGDILAGVFSGNVRSIELERDLSSIPMETDIDHIEEIVLTEDIEHTIYITFLPVIDGSLIPIKYGGGLRSVTLCGEFAFEDAPSGDCDIPTIIADEEFFTEEYAPQIFGEYFSETQANEVAQAALYDDTPQSIAPDAPVGVPDERERNALCGAVQRFVELYASTKLCLIQSKNFVEVMWTKLTGAANEFYGAATSLISPIYSPNIFSCFVSDAAAITALQNDAAIEELACFIYDELKSVAMSQSNFDDAILAAATTLSGNAADIACLMQNDNNQSLYINFLESYQINLQKIINNVDVPCPCETQEYKLWAHDFANGMGPFIIAYTNNIAIGALSGGMMVGNDIGSSKMIQMEWNGFNTAWRIHGVKLYITRAGSALNGTLDTTFVYGQPYPNNSHSRITLQSSGAQSDGVQTRCHDIPFDGWHDGFRQLIVAARVSDTGASSSITMSKIEILFDADYAPSGYLTEDADLCT